MCNIFLIATKLTLYVCVNIECVVEAELLRKQAPEPKDFDSFVREAMVLDGKDKAVPAGGDNAVNAVNLV